jgi:HEPN domain-containing protein
MTPRVQAWLRQAADDLAMAELARRESFHSQACYHASQAAEKACKAVLIGVVVEPPRSHSLERLVEALEAVGLDTQPLRALRLPALSRMNTATRYPDGEEAPRDLFDGRDSEDALQAARAVLAWASQALGGS